MRANAVVQRLWGGADSLLLVAVMCLLAYSWWDARRLATQGGAPGRPARSADLVWEPAPPPRQPSRVIEGLPVATDCARMSRIARNMVEGGWDDVPAHPAADMRERDGHYDILVALPGTLDPQSVKVSAAGNVLSLFVNAYGQSRATFVKQFFIPCGAERAGAVVTSVSNQTIRIRISQPNGSAG